MHNIAEVDAARDLAAKASKAVITVTKQLEAMKPDSEHAGWFRFRE